MSAFFNILNSVVGGRTIDETVGNTYRIILYVVLYVVYALLLYLRVSDTFALIFSIALGVLVLLFKLATWAINKVAQRSVSVSHVALNNIAENCPPGISPGIWEMRNVLRNPVPDLETTVNDLINAGFDLDELTQLVDYIRNNPAVEEENEVVESENVISFCGKIWNFKIRKETFDDIFMANHSLIFCICAGIMAFAGSYLMLHLNTEFKNSERWWIAYVISSAIFSILHPVLYEPFMTSVTDYWCGLARTVALSTLSGLWIGLLKLEKHGKTVTPFYDLTINWEKVNSYLIECCRWGILLFPIWLLGNMISHPVSFIVSLIEGICRYAFGQNGVGGIPHMFVQIIRGGVSVVLAWVLLEKKKNEIYIYIALAVVTFISMLPLSRDKSILKNIYTTILRIIIATALAFLSPYIFTHIIKGEYSKIKWICFGFLMFSDVVFPYVESCNKYFFFYLLLLRTIPFAGTVRELITQICVPLFVASSIQESGLNNWYLAFIIVHSIYKGHSEPTIFALAVFISVATLYYDYDFHDKSINLFISLLIASKMESFYKLLRYIYSSRYLILVIFEEFFDDYDNNDLYNFIFYPLLRLMSMYPSIDFIIKIPSLIWGFITGGNIGVYLGIGYLTVPFPIRPYYFFDWPKTKENIDGNLFTSNRREHSIEMPVYTSTFNGLVNSFTDWVKSGKFGYVQVGDIYLIISGDLMGFIHVISMEPNNIKIQFRGLEYKSTTACHRGEASFLDKIYEDFEVFPNIKQLSVFSNSIYELRNLNTKFESYDFSMTLLSNAFNGITRNNLVMGCFYSLCHQITKVSLNVNDIQDNEQNETQNDLNQEMRQFFDASNFQYNENYISKYMVLWNLFKKLFYEGDYFSPQKIVAGFKNEILGSDDLLWALSNDNIFSNVIIQTLYLSIGVNFMNSVGLGYGESDEMEDIVSFFNEFEETCIVTPINSTAFSKAFKSKDRTIISITDSTGQPSIVRFYTSSDTVWHVFQVNQEYVRGLWASESLDILFHQTDNNERISIQQNIVYLNNLISQANELPIGYPAYVSSIRNSFSKPYSK